jgi:AcrR family transcriptional regulator
MMHTDSTHVKGSSAGGPPSRKAAQSEATRAKLVRAGRTLFGKKGYANVGTEEIVRAAGVTRGALYHQFADKRELFAAVFEDTETELIAEAARNVAGVDDPVEALRRGFAGWLEAAARPAVQRIVLLDAPVVLGWDEWRAIGERLGLGATMAALRAAMDAGAIAEQPVRPLAHVVMGALDEAALYVARADDQVVATGEMAAIIDRLVESLRA